MKRPTYSIRYKFLAVMTALLILCVGSYLMLASREFKNDKKSLVFDYNQSLVVNVASDIESFMTAQGDKMRLLSLFYREPKAKREQLIADLMRDRQDLVYVAGTDRTHAVSQEIFSDAEYSKTYSLSAQFWQGQLPAVRPIPYEQIEQEGHAVWNAAVPNGPPILGFGKSVIEEDDRGVPVNQFTVVGYVRMDRLLHSLEQGRPNEVYLLSRAGEILAHPKPELMQSAQHEKGGLFQLASRNVKTGQIQRSVAEYVEAGEQYLGAYAFSFHKQILVVSKISEKKAFRAVNRLVFRSLLFASMVMTLAFMVAILFSRSLTRPLDTLMQGMSQVAAGDLNSQIEVHSRDEISLLAQSFNRMTRDLKISRQELEDINRDLENKVRERTHQLELQNRAVKEAQEALLRTTRLAAVGEVAGQAAHEVLNPLTTIISRLQKLKERIQRDRAQEVQTLLTINSEWQRDYQEGGFSKLMQSWKKPSALLQGQSLWDEDIRNIKQIGENVVSEYLHLVQDADFLLHESSRIQRLVNSFRSHNVRRGEFEAHSVQDLCQKSIHVMADLAMKDGIRLDASFDAQEVVAMLDPDEFLQVMTNLLRNAFQSVVGAPSHQQGKGSVRVATENQDGKIVVHIEDNGKGIAPKIQTRLFEKHFTTKPKYEGTGIGLSISRRLVRSYNGDIYLKSSVPGQGAHFVIELPIAQKIAVSKRGAA